MNSEEPQKKVHFYGGCFTDGYYFIQNGNPEKVFSFGYGYYGELANGKSFSKHKINVYPTPQVCTQIPKTGKVKQISKGRCHALFLMYPKEDVYGVGHSEYGALSTKQREVLTPILLYSSALENVKMCSVSCGYLFSVLLSKKGVPYSCGDNSYGQCGVGTNSHVFSAIPMKFNEKVIQIDCGRHYTVLLTNKRDIYKTGRFINEKFVNIPTKLYLNEKVKYFRAGYYHLLVVGKSEQLYGIGDNDYSQLASTISRNGINVLTKINTLNGKKIKDVKCSMHNSYALLENGDLFGWGDNTYGQSKGNGSVSTYPHCNPTPFKMRSNVIQVEAGSYFCFAFCDDGVYVCGYDGTSSTKNYISTFTLNTNIKNVKKVKKHKVIDFDSKTLLSSIDTLSNSSQSLQDILIGKLKNEIEQINLKMKEKETKFKNTIEILKKTIEEMKTKTRIPINTIKSKDKIIFDHTKYIIKSSDILLMKVIGSGGFGECHLSKWDGDGGGVDVVVKKITLKGVKITPKKVFDEIKVQFDIRNPSICRIFGYSIPNPQTVYIVMEKMDYDVNKMIKGNKFTLVEKLKIMEKMTQSVHVIHSMNILHRDLKCANFLADKSGNIKLTDFGIATVMTHSQTHIQSGGKGSLPWMDPTLVDDDDYDDDNDDDNDVIKVFSKETDIYSLGCCFFEVLFEKEPYGIMNYKFQKKAKKIKKFPQKIITMVLSCIQEDKDERPNTLNLLKWFREY